MRNKQDYHLCRYDYENVVDLTTFSKEEIALFASSFGIPIVHEKDYTRETYHNAFVGSPCHLELKHWVIKHPKISTRSTYAPNRLTLLDISNWSKQGE